MANNELRTTKATVKKNTLLISVGRCVGMDRWIKRVRSIDGVDCEPVASLVQRSQHRGGALVSSHRTVASTLPRIIIIKKKNNGELLQKIPFT